MSGLVLQPTSTAQWYSLVNEAECISSHHLSEDIESYLVFLLMRFADNPEILDKIVATEYLNSQRNNKISRDRLKEVGDTCLLYAGLFPHQAERRHVKISYFVDLGRSAYQHLANLGNQGQSNQNLFTLLSQHFVSLMDVLQTMRDLGDESASLGPLHAFELWDDTGSNFAYSSLQGITKAIPVKTDLNIRDRELITSRFH